MTTFKADTYQNQYLPAGGTEVNAVVQVTASDAGATTRNAAHAAEVVLIDVSGSMNYPRSKIRSARDAAVAAIDCIRDGVYFGIVAGTEDAVEIYPGNGELAESSEQTRKEAKKRVSGLTAGGGTAIGRWLQCADRLFAAHAGAIRHAILLTDGKNENETPEELDAALSACAGTFQCDCRGVGADWVVEELREVAAALMGEVALIREPEQMVDDFTELMQRAMGRGVNDVALRIWTPQGATVRFVKQVSPETEDLSDRRVEAGAAEGDYPTGAWGDETRDYHVCIDVPSREVGEQMLAARLKLVVDDEVLSEAKILAEWTSDEALSTALNPQVVQASGRADYARETQAGVQAIREDDLDHATAHLGRAVRIADALDDDEKLRELAQVVDIVDAATGQVRPKGEVDELDLMEADLGSTKTARTVRPSP